MSWRNEFDPDQAQRRKMARLSAKLRQLQREAMKYGVDITPHLIACIQDAEREIVDRKAA